MTTRDPSARKTTPQAERTRPIRNGADVRARSAPRAPAGDPAASMDEAVAQAVQSSYDVLDEAVRQTRSSMDRLQKGDMSMDALPGDIASISLKAIEVARQLSTSTLNLCEQMVTQMSAAAAPPPPGEVAAQVPPFRSTIPQGANHAEGSIKAPRDVGEIEFETHFTGHGKAVSHSSRMKKPQRPTRPEEIRPTKLEPHGAKAEPLKCSAFTAALGERPSISIRIPTDQPPGFYNGLIMAEGQDVPLGVLTIEVLATS